MVDLDELDQVAGGIVYTLIIILAFLVPFAAWGLLFDAFPILYANGLRYYIKRYVTVQPTAVGDLAAVSFFFFLCSLLGIGTWTFRILRGFLFGNWSDPSTDYKGFDKDYYRGSRIYSRLRIKKLVSVGLFLSSLGATIEGWDFLWQLLKKLELHLK
jgi:hypothetical protein